MFYIITFLIWRLSTVDGRKGSAIPYLNHVNEVAINKVTKVTNGRIS